MIYHTLSLSLLLIIIYIFYHYQESVFYLLKTVNAKWFLAGIICYFVNYVFRAFRFYQFLSFDKNINPIHLLKTATFHGFYNYFLPVRSGDATLPFLLKMYCSIPLSRGTGVLIKARLQDLITLGGILCIVILFNRLPISNSALTILLLFSVILIICPLLLIKLVRENRVFIPRKLKERFEAKPPEYPKPLELFMSLMIWISTGGTIYSVVKAINVPLRFWDIWVLISIQLPLQLLPIQGLANAGNHEIGWTSALKILGINLETSIHVALSSHLILIVYVIILGGLALCMPPLRPQSSGNN